MYDEYNEYYSNRDNVKNRGNENEILNENINESTNQSVNECINNFIFDNSYNILLFSETLKGYFNYNPDFLCKLNSNALLDLILYKKFNEFNKFVYKNKNAIQIFVETFNVELNTSLNLINLFLKKFKVSIKKDDWDVFCLIYSTLPYFT